MSKRQLTLQKCCHTAKRRRPPPQASQSRQYVYLVVDDWESGYSVRKIDIDAMYSDAGADLDDDDKAEPLPDPPVVRFYGQHCRLSQFGAYGTSILAMPMHSDETCPIPIFDTKTLGVTLCSVPDGGSPKPLFASVAGEHYMILGSSVYMRRTDQVKQCSWTKSHNLAPFMSDGVVSFAVHPNDRLLFISIAARTFFLVTKCLSWMTPGNWVMPFKGQAYFDDKLDAWVGLCRHKGGVGYVCSCEVPPMSDYTKMTTMPAWKLGDQLFNADDDRHLGATLLYLGGISDYCLIESRLHKDQEPFRPFDGPLCRVLRVTKFSLKYDKNGELRTTRRTACSYQMTEGHELNHCVLLPDD